MKNCGGFLLATVIYSGVCVGMIFSWFNYFSDPLVLFGLVLLFGSLVFKYLHKHKIIKQLPVKFQTGMPKLLLDYGFVLGLAVVFLGMSLKHNELKEAEQDNALMLLQSEYENNLATIKQLSQNTVDVLQAHRLLEYALHTDGSKILSTIFPKLSVREKEKTTISKQVTASFEELNNLRLLKSKSHMAVFNAVKDKIKQVLKAQTQLLSERQDIRGGQYVIEDKIWLGYREIIAGADDFDAKRYESVLQQLVTLRVQYDTVLVKVDTYFKETSSFMNRSTFLSNGDVYEVLVKERASEDAVTEFVTVLRDELKVIEQAENLFNRN